MSIFAQIEALAHEQQNLWREASRKRLKDDKRQRLITIQRELATLWHQHRCELAAVGRGEWRHETHSRDRNLSYAAQSSIDRISILDFVSVWHTERQRIEAQTTSGFDQKWEAERQRLNQLVKHEMEAETAEERRIAQVVSVVVHGASVVAKSFNPHEASLRQLREYRRQSAHMGTFAGTL